MSQKAERAISIYGIPQALDLAPRHSALLQFLATPVAARPVVWFSSRDALAERAVALSNDTAHSLPAGPLAVYRDGGFLGEAVLDGLQPGARQFARICQQDRRVSAPPHLPWTARAEGLPQPLDCAKS